MTELFESLNSHHYLFAAGYSLLTVVVWWCVYHRFVGSPPFLLILSGQAKYFFIPFKGTSKPNQKKKNIYIS